MKLELELFLLPNHGQTCQANVGTDEDIVRCNDTAYARVRLNGGDYNVCEYHLLIMKITMEQISGDTYDE